MKKSLIILGLFLSFNSIAFASPSDLERYNATGNRSPSWDELIAPGFESFDGQNYATAFVFFNEAYKKGCRDGLVLAKLGVIHEVNGRYKEAAQIFAMAAPHLKQAYQDHPLASSIDGYLGRIYYQLDMFDKALPYLENALAKNPNDFMLLFMSGQLLRANKRYDAAYDRFKRAMKATPPQGIKPPPQLALIKELMILTYEMKKYDETVLCADAILKVDPKNRTAKSYKEQIERQKFQQSQETALDKLLERIK
jgi:tetratricopeptide (TPR) repeat protein